MTDERYPRLAARGIPIAEPSDQPRQVAYGSLIAWLDSLQIPESWRVEDIPFEARCGRLGPYADDVERFLSSLPGEE